jgi:hypothetical protein
VPNGAVGENVPNDAVGENVPNDAVEERCAKWCCRGEMCQMVL